jgi:polyhydroxybutyrate depolymerase
VLLRGSISLAVIFLMLSAINCADGKERKRFRLIPKDFRKSVQWIKRVPGKHFSIGPGDYGRRIRVGRLKRFYHIHVPSSYRASKPAPVVLVFHGGGGDPGGIQYESGMDKTADREGFIVVYPAGSPSKRILKNRLLLWNDGRPRDDGTYSTVDDVAFVDALLDDLAVLFNIDKSRIYACGFSNGAQFTYRLVKRRSNRIAAISVVAGQRPPKDRYDPAPPRPIPLMQFAGKQDKVGPYYGGQTPEAAGLKAVAKPVTETVKSWVDFNKCPARSAEDKKIGNAVMVRYGPCKDGSEVVFWTLEDGGHTWPGGNVSPNVEMLGLGSMGKVNRDINASDLMWKFFRKHTLK